MRLKSLIRDTLMHVSIYLLPILTIWYIFVGLILLIWWLRLPGGQERRLR